MKRLVEMALRNRANVVVFFALASGLGFWAITRIPLDAVPDITPVQVVINTKTGALDPEQIEKSVSYPIETEMGGIPHVQRVRSLSKYGLSQVTVTLEDGTDIYWARQMVSERLQNLRTELPADLAPQLAPITTALGEVVMYAVQAKPGSSLAAEPEEKRLLDLRTAQDFVIAPYLRRSVANVADVDSLGGFQKEIRIAVHPEKLEKYGLTIEGVSERLGTLGENFGGGYIQQGGKQIIIRTAGSLPSLESIGILPVSLDVLGKPVLLKAVADVYEGHAQRVGFATDGGQETVLGTVLMLAGANSREVALDAKRALSAIPLPPDVEVKLLYSRSFLVDETLKTVRDNLFGGASLVVVVLLVILGNVRTAICVSLAIPLSVLLGGIAVRYLGVSANLMSLGALDFGLLVDGAVVMIENIWRRLGDAPRSQALDRRARLEIVRSAAAEVVRPMTLGLSIIMLVYVPILSLQGIEGKFYRPMALTVLAALLASLVVAVLFMPVLGFLFLKVPRETQSGEKRGTLAFRLLRRVYEPILHVTMRHPIWTLVPAIGLAIAAAIVAIRMGADFMPVLNEGDFLFNLSRPPDIGLDASLEMQKKSNAILASFPEVERVFARTGTAESALDPAGVNDSDTLVILRKDRPITSPSPLVGEGQDGGEEGKRTSGASAAIEPADKGAEGGEEAPKGPLTPKAALGEAMKKAIETGAPGQEVAVAQPIQDRFNDILEGSRADLSLRIYGKDLTVLMDLIQKAIDLLKPIQGIEQIEQDPLTALKATPVLSIQPNYPAIARYGLDIRRVKNLLSMAMGGLEVGSFYQDQWRFPIVVKLAEKEREQIGAIKALPVSLPDGGTIPLSSVADFELKEQPSTIAHDYARRYASVAVWLAGRDVTSFMRDARAAIEKGLTLPAGYNLAWSGQFEYLSRARARLSVIVPAILLVILLILWQTFGSIRQALLVYVSIPLAMTGGVIALRLRDMPFTVSASIGFIALMGIAILNGMILVAFFNRLREEGASPAEAAREGTLIRLRPVVATALVASLGFVPMAVNTGIGAEVQRPLATVVIGGIFSATFLTLLVLPALYAWIEERATARNTRA